ncbi:hypothetical protein [Paucisalibacillus sp. EB02]|uniref:hypothetical protein n=1 Tax=Paucisalibacillus sp. EB02 TaxID=1347087 RepID=UPI0004B43063|nr:hypothetical protein [Paucisalibacillus sp. EB02]
MYLVLRAQYTVIDAKELILSHLFEDKHHTIKISSNIDREQLIQKLLYGFRIPMDINEISQEEKFIIKISKQLKDSTLLTEEKTEYRRQINMRGVLLAANKSGVYHSVIKDYFNTFHEQRIYTLGTNQELHSYFLREGLFQTRSITKEDLTSTDERSIILINEKDLPTIQGERDKKYLVYSLESLRVGPLLIPGTTICLKCYNNNYHLQRNNVENGYPVYYQNFILNFLVNTVYFCLNDLHNFLGTDVGLPIRKYYQLANPYLSISVTDVYKTSNCSICFSENAVNEFMYDEAKNVRV